MDDVKDYCDKSYRRMVGLKAGLYNVIAKTEKASDPVHADAVKQLMALVENIETGLDELKNQCPSDWSPNKKNLDENMARLSDTLSEVADRLGIAVPDTTAWI
jgi:molecular chaperone GrpE (heat shock protein)